jgi:integrase
MAMLAEILASRGITATTPDALVFVVARTAAGFTELNFRDLKHTTGTALLDEGVNIKIAQARLGHANPRTTLAVYAQATAEADREAANRLGERFRPKAGRTSRSSTR